MPQRKSKPKASAKSARKPSGKSKKKSTARPAKKSTAKAARKPAKKAARRPSRSGGKRLTSRAKGRSGGSTRRSSKAAQKAPVARGQAAKPVGAKLRHSQSRIDQLRAMLETKRSEILQEIKRARMDGINIDRTSFPEVGDLVSASVEKERAFEHSEAGVNALREIDSALEKLKEGTYGVCEICGKPVGLKRLTVMPSARLCIKCKSKEEASGGLGNRRSS